MTARPRTWKRSALAASMMLALAPAPARAAAPTPAAFSGFVAALRPDAERAGIPDDLFDATFAGVTPDPSLVPLTRAQPEFAKPIGAYLAAQVTPGRVAAGRAALARWRDALAGIQAQYGVPPEIVVAVWGLETNYGAAAGGK
ncbi:MAG: lytic murein transglycosylase, partial [Caulobacteraceae bacterium]|nr:lytic murein transglycosylase [Caulobacter sp.]